MEQTRLCPNCKSVIPQNSDTCPTCGLVVEWEGGD